jgi:hypothetical protein
VDNRGVDGLAELEAGLDDIRRSPADAGTVELIVRRPAVDEREVLDEAILDCTVGLVGDTWSVRSSRKTPDGSPNPLAQLTLMNCRAATLFAGGRGRWALAGDQLFVDLDLSEANLPPGTRLEVGTAVVEISIEPHTGCAKFVERFGPAAGRMVSHPDGRALRLRGVNAMVVTGGVVRQGDTLTVRR